jgi:hypothetical protein
MDTNLYEPPKSDVSVTDDTPGSTIKAVALGALVEIVGSLLVGMAIGILYMFLLSQQGVPPQEMQSALEQMGPWSGFSLLGMALGTVVSVLAGYVCARIANRVSYIPASLVAGISFALTLLFGYSSHPLFELIGLGLISACAVLAGAWFYIRKLKRG